MELNDGAVSVFSFLNAVRTHRPVCDIEECRRSLQAEDGGNTYSHSDALKYAIMYGHAEYSDYLLSTFLDDSLSQSVCCPLLLLAVRLDMPLIVEQLCKYSLQKAEHRNYINKAGCSAMECGRTALHVSAETGNLVCTRLLLKYGADFSCTDDYGHTPVRRILYRLLPPHINSKTVFCLIELFKCQGSITGDDLSSFNKILAGCIVNAKEQKQMDLQWLYTAPGPFSLKQICRCVIRRSMMYPQLSSKLQNCGLPQSLVRYLLLEEVYVKLSD